MVYPVVLIAIPIPTFSLAKVNIGLPPKDTSSPDSTPLKPAVPLAVAAVVLSYALSIPVNPVMVSSLLVISAESVGCVRV